MTGIFHEKLESELELLSAEAKLKVIGRQEFLELCEKMFSALHIQEDAKCLC